MRVWLAAFWIVGIAAAPAQAAFELRPHRLGNVSWMPRLEEPFSPRGPVTEPGWSTGWLHASHQGASDVSLDAIAVARSGSSSWGVRVARLGTAHYSEWMTQASLRPFPHLSLAIEHLTSGGDAAFRELGIRSYSAVTLSAAAQRALGRRVRLEIAGNDWVRGGPTEKLGIVPALDLRGDLRIGRGVSLGFGRSWWFAEGKRSGSTFGVSWTPHPHLSLGQSITDGSGLTHWLSFGFDRIALTLWQSDLSGRTATSGVAVSLRRFGSLPPAERSAATIRQPGRPAAPVATGPTKGASGRLVRPTPTAEFHGVGGSAVDDPNLLLEDAGETGEPIVTEPFPWDLDPGDGETWASNWADSLWAVQDSLEERVRGIRAAPAPASSIGIPIPLGELRGGAVAMLLGLDAETADSLAQGARSIHDFTDLPWGQPNDPMRNLAPYLTARERPRSMEAASAVDSDRNVSSVRIEGTRVMGARGRASQRLEVDLHEGMFDLAGRARWTGPGIGTWQSLRLVCAGWTVMGGHGFATPSPRGLWYAAARTRRRTGATAFWVEAPARDGWSGLAAVSADDASLEVRYRRRTFDLSVARLPRELGRAQLLMRVGPSGEAWTWSLRSVSARSLFAGAQRDWVSNWSRFTIRTRARWEDRLGPAGFTDSVHDPIALRFRREVTVSATRRPAHVDASVEWRARGTSGRVGAARDETRRWRASGRFGGFGARAELRVARSHTAAFRAAAQAFEPGTPTQDARTTARCFLTRERRGHVQIPGLELGSEQRTTNTGSWLGRWWGMWIEGRRHRLDWTIGLMELLPATGRTVGVAPRWIGGRRFSVSESTVLVGGRTRLQGRFGRWDLRALRPLSPPGSTRLELAMRLASP